MGILVQAKKRPGKGSLVHYDYWMDGEEHRGKGEFFINLLTGDMTLIRKARNDSSGYGYARIQLKIKRIMEMTQNFPETVLWAS